MTKKFKTLNRALSLLLAVIMVIGIVPVTALANSGAIPTGDPAPVEMCIRDRNHKWCVAGPF